MSNVIDERVVQMEFDNQRFERNVSTSISTLDKLKAALKLDGATNGLSAIEKQSNKLDFSNLSSSIEAISSRFSSLGIIGTSILQNIGNEVFKVGQQIKGYVDSMTFDQIGVGWNKYAEKTTSVQTIMAATAETWEKDATAAMRAQAMMEQGVDPSRAYEYAAAYYDVSKGIKTADQAAKELYITTDQFNQLGGINAAYNGDDIAYAGSQMDYVNSQMEKLNWFTDETSYNFVDMTSNIGKFTSNNIPLSQAATAMQGIANLAALSGQNAGAASRAMYNFAQSIGAGSVKLMDWRSIENANMATSQFKQEILDSAAAMGTLTKEADGTYKTLKGTKVTVEGFSQTLSEGWFSKDVLMDSLNKYGAFTDQLYKVSEATGLTATDILGLVEAQKKAAESPEAMADYNEKLARIAKKEGLDIEELSGHIEKLSSDEYELGRQAFKAAQEAKTFQDAIDATKDAASTRWMNIFENIFGDYEKARHVWTDFANFLYDILVAPLEKVEEISEYFAEANGLDRVRQAFSDISTLLTGDVDEGIAGVLDSFKKGFEDVLPPIEITTEKIDAFLTKITDFTSNLKLSDEQIQKFQNAGRGLANIVAFIGNSIKNLWKATEPLRTALAGLAKAIGGAVVNLLGMASDMDNTGLKGEGLRKICEILAKVINAVSNAIKGLNFDKIKSSFSGLSGIFNALSNAFNWLFSSLGNIDFSAGIGSAVDWIKEKFESLKSYLSGLDWGNIFKGALGTGILGLLGAKLFKTVKTIKKPFETLSDLKDKVGGVLDSIGDAFKSFEKKANIESFKSIATAILILAGALFVLGIVNYEKAVVGLLAIAGVMVALYEAMKLMKGFDKAKMATLAASMLIAAAAMLVFAVALGVLAGALALFALVAKMDSIAEGFALMAGTLAVALVSLKILSKMSPKVLISAAALLVFATALLVLAAAIAAFALVAKMDTAWDGVLLLAGALLVLVAALVALSTVALKALVGAAALMVTSAALLVLAGALAAFAGIASMSTAWAGVAMLAATLLILTAALIALGAAGPVVLVGAAALLVAAAACIVLAAAVAAVSLALPLLGAGLAALGLGIGSAVASISEGVATFFSSLSASIIYVGTAIGQLVSSIGTGIGEAVAALGEGVGQAIEDIIASVGEGIGRGITAISDSIGTFGNNLSKASLGIENLGNAVRTLEGISWGSTALGIAELALALKKLNVSDLAASLGEASSSIIQACTSMIASLMSLGPSMTNAGRTMGLGFVNGIRSQVASVQSAAIALGGAAIPAISSYSGAWSTLGSNLAIGFANGIYARIGSVSAAASTMANAATKTIQISIDAHSPSRVTTKFGGYFGQGFANGIRSEISNAASASDDLVNGTMSAVESAKNLIGRILQDDFTPVISPVVDLSNVTAAANSVNSSFGVGRIGLSGELSNAVASRISTGMSEGGQNITNNSGDTLYITNNIYASEGMDEQALADAVMSRMQAQMARRSVAFG